MWIDSDLESLGATHGCWRKGWSQWSATERAPRHVVKARHVGDYRVWLQFSDGRKGLVDLADELHGEIFEPLRDPRRFARLYLDCKLATIAWDHGADSAPEYLYEKLATMH